jgi:hypothetical protein
MAKKYIGLYFTGKNDDETLTRNYTLQDLIEFKVKPIFDTEENAIFMANDT